MNEQLKIVRHIPEGFLNIKPQDITKLIGCPTIIHLKGKRDEPLFVSILLHGNEFSGLVILQNILKKYESGVLPRSLIVFIGNPRACAQGERHLKDQPDFNRIWSKNRNHFLAKSVLQYAEDQKIYAAVDIHNNTGQNPFYACISEKKQELIKLAQAFSENIVYFVKPDSVLSIAFAPLAPALVIECGLPGDSKGIVSGVRFIESLFDEGESWKTNMIQVPHIYSTYATLSIDPDSNLSFNLRSFLKKDHVYLTSQLDRFNFKQIPAGTILGKVNQPDRIRLIDKDGKNVFNQFFSIVENNWIVKTPFIPSMFTKDISIAKSDCLGYVMQKIPIEDFFDNPEGSFFSS